MFTHLLTKKSRSSGVFYPSGSYDDGVKYINFLTFHDNTRWTVDPGVWNAGGWYTSEDYSGEKIQLSELGIWVENYEPKFVRFYHSGATEVSLLIENKNSDICNNNWPNDSYSGEIIAMSVRGADMDHFFVDGNDPFTITNIQFGNEVFNFGGEYLFIGNADSAESYCLFPSVTIPQGATILTAYITFTTSDVASDNIDIDIHFEDSDDAAVPRSVPEFDALTLTTAKAIWSFVHPGINTEYNTPSIVSVIQEVVDRGSWVSGNDMMAVLKDGGSSTLNEIVNLWSLDKSAGAYKPELHVSYSVA